MDGVTRGKKWRLNGWVTHTGREKKGLGGLDGKDFGGVLGKVGWMVS